MCALIISLSITYYHTKHKSAPKPRLPSALTENQQNNINTNKISQKNMIVLSLSPSSSHKVDHKRAHFHGAERHLQVGVGGVECHVRQCLARHVRLPVDLLGFPLGLVLVARQRGLAH